MSKIISMLDFLFSLTSDIAKLRTMYKAHHRDYQ
jgi:hypothetical protein